MSARKREREGKKEGGGRRDRVQPVCLYVFKYKLDTILGKGI